jgi:hypothetical protein
MDIHLATPGGQREGPFSLEQINASLAQRKYRETDYWAWFEGLDSWVPLHEVPGIINAPAAPDETRTVESSGAPQSDTQIVHRQASDSAKSGPAKLFSGMPAQRLEQIFVFTNGEGPMAMQSPVTAMMLKEIIGADIESLGGKAPRDVFGRCSIPAQLAEQAKVPASAWRAMSALRPQLTQQARDGGYRICVRTFEIEEAQQVAIFLFYRKQED